MLAVNLLALRRVFGPLERLTALMRRVDPLAPGQRIEIERQAAEVAELSHAFNDMLDRLERERRDSARRALDAQEEERRRMARELHDEIGQTLTGVVLAARDARARARPRSCSAELRSLEASVRAGIEEVRELVRRLRPEALDDFGLRSALVSLGSELAEHSGLRVSPRLDGDLPTLSPEDELVVYRVAQESLVNVVRHARATRAELSLQAENGAVVLRVRDDGKGIDAAGLRSGNGVRGMRERALLVGADLQGQPRPAARHRGAAAAAGQMTTHPLKIRILLADDHTVVRRGIRMVLEAAPDLEVVAEAADGIEAVQRALREDIDLAILDVAMPRRTGLQAALELSKQRPDLKILMLSMHEVEQYFFEALKAGASGYVLKTAAGRDLVEACRAAMRGEPFLYPPAVRGIMRDYLERAADGDVLREEPLTPRELEVLKLVAEAHSSEQIAELLIISPRTVERHRENIMGKLGMRDRVQLTRYAIRRGLVEP